MWTRFTDIHSFGYKKTQYSAMFIEANLDRAVEAFEARFQRNPYNVTCTCCGPDYSVYEDEAPDESEVSRDDVCVIPAAEVLSLIGPEDALKFTKLKEQAAACAEHLEEMLEYNPSFTRHMIDWVEKSVEVLKSVSKGECV